MTNKMGRNPLPLFSRRRAIGIFAGLAAWSVLPMREARAAGLFYEWQGRVMGARARLVLSGLEEGDARAVVSRALDEIERLENIFSLYRDDSELSRLNRLGVLENPSAEMRELLSLCHSISDRSGGAFDVSIQPLFRLYADHFLRPDADPRGPARADLARVRALVDYRAIGRGEGKILLRRPGMALSFNGVAQGYITDRVAGLLRAAGLRHVLCELGETLALGPQADGTPWRIAISDPRDTARVLQSVDLSGGAIATSSPAGFFFDEQKRHHHLFDPHRGQSAHYLLQASVQAPTAALADALSTTFCVLPFDSARLMMGGMEKVSATVFLPDGRVQRLSRQKGAA